MRASTTGMPSGLRGVAFRAVLFLGMSVAAVIVFALSSLAPLITGELGLSRFQFGLLPSVHSLLGGLSSVIAGRIVDAQGGRRSMVALFTIGVVGSLWASVAFHYLILLLAVALLSVPLALSNPATNHLISAHVPAPAQGRTVGLKQAGTPAGTALAGLTLPPLALLFGWRPALGLLACVAGLGLVLVLLGVPRTEVKAASRSPSSAVPADLRTMARWLALFAFLMGSGMGSINAFVPLYGHEVLGVSVTVAGQIAATIGLSAICSRIAWGLLCNRMQEPIRALKFLGCLAAVAVACLVAAAYVDWRLAWLAAVGIGCTSGTWHVPVMLGIIRTVGPHSGELSGHVMRGFLTGMVTSPVVFGLVVDAGIGYTAGWSGVALCFLAAGLVQLTRERWVAGRRAAVGA